MKTIVINVKDDYVDNVVMMLNGLSNIMIETIEVEDLKINKQLCLNTLEKIKADGLNGFNPIVDVDTHIKGLVISKKLPSPTPPQNNFHGVKQYREV